MDFNGLVPYNFEPEFSEEELNELENERNSETAQAFIHVTDFCSCENCIMMPSSDENTCCRSNDLTIGNIEDLECITEHSHFETIVLNPVVLEVAFIQIMAYKGSRGRTPDALSSTQSRLTAYRQFVCWMMKGERLGKGNRLVLPSCVVKRVRDRFPSPDSEYCGFRLAMDNIQDLFP